MPVQCKKEVEFPGVLDIIRKNHLEFLALLHFKPHFFIDDSVAEFHADSESHKSSSPLEINRLIEMKLFIHLQSS